MDQITCTTDGCDAPVSIQARGLCARCYGRAYRAGELEPLPGSDRAHRLTDVDKEARTAVCSVCGPTTIRMRSSSERGSECMTGRREQGARRRRRRSLEPSSGGSRSTTLADDRRRWTYSLTQDQLDALVAESDGRCLICDVDTQGDYCVDHCHETGLVRGILCRRCNFGLGWFDDDPARILAAHIYLTARGKAA